MSIELTSSFPLMNGRAHEVFGPGSVLFALSLGGMLSGPVLWVRERWRSDVLNPNGFSDILSPDRLLIANTKDHIEVLAVGEEALRSGAVALVVMETGKAVGLTEGRRLQLAAKEGGSTALAMIREGMGSNAAQTRWHCRPVYDPNDSTLQEWKLIKNKSGTNGSWYVRWSQQTRRIIVVSPAVQ